MALLSAEHERALQAYHREGVALLHDFLPAEHLAVLRRVCGEMISEVDGQIDGGGGDLVRPLTHKGERYFIDFVLSHKPELRDLIFSDRLREVCRRVLPEPAAATECWHHKQQFVVKYPRVDMEFAWHQDSGYMWEQPHTPWITCWIALDDVSESNGTIYVLPHTRSEHSDAAIGSLAAVTPHALATDGSNDLIGYSGAEEGVPVEMKAGGMAVFSSTTFHRSGRNASGDVRRAYLCTYSHGEMELKEGTTRQNVLVPLGTDPPRL